MRDYSIIGFKKCKNGVWVYVSFESKGVEGLEVERLYCSYDYVQGLDKLKVGGACVPFYNKYGRVDSIVIK